jgi:hypothetical protein
LGTIASMWKRLRTRLYDIRSFLRPDVALLQGVTGAGASVRILRAGLADRPAAYFLAGQIYDELFAETDLGRHWLWALPALGRSHGCAFVLFRTPRDRVALARRFLRRAEGQAFYLPLYVTLTVDIANEAALLRSNSVQQDVRKITKEGFHYSISRKSYELATFMRDYHDPWVKRVHGFDVLGMDSESSSRLWEDEEVPEPWVLLKVHLGGAWIAGTLLVSSTDAAALMEIGVKDANADYVKRGALLACYWFAFDFLRRQGHARVNLMFARPFLRNGVLQYKLKFKPYLRPMPADGFLMIPDMESDDAREILLQQPILAWGTEGLEVVWFTLDPNDTPDRTRVPIDLSRVEGVSAVERIVLSAPR